MTFWKTIRVRGCIDLNIIGIHVLMLKEVKLVFSSPFCELIEQLSRFPSVGVSNLNKQVSIT